MKLEELERRLRADMTRDAAQWGGKVLLHREVQLPSRARSPSLRPPHAGPAAAPRAVPSRASPLQLGSEVQAAASSGQQSAGDGTPASGVPSSKVVLVETAALLYVLAVITVAAPQTQIGRVIWQDGLHCIVCSLPWAARCWQPHLGP